MTDRKPLLDAIRADPNAIGPRLVYADWCEERGEVIQAELIRVECELATLPKVRRKHLHRCPNLEDRRLGLMCQSNALRFKFQTPFEDVELRFFLGMVCEVVCSWEFWKVFGNAISDTQPIKEVGLRNWPEHGDNSVLFSFERIDEGHIFRQRATCDLWPGIVFRHALMGRQVTVSREDIFTDRTGQMFIGGVRAGQVRAGDAIVYDPSGG